MKKLMLALSVVGLFGMSLFIASKASADGAIQPGLIANNGGQYYYPTTQAPATGGVLVNTSGPIFGWSNQASTASVVGVGLQAFTLAQLQVTTPGAAGLMVYCSNCASRICISTGTTQNAWVIASSTDAANGNTTNACH